MPSRRIRIPRSWADVFTKQERLQIRKRLVYGAAAFTILSWGLLIAINFGGYPSNGGLLEDDMYMMKWVSVLPLNPNGTQSVAITVNYYLNAIWLLDERASSPVQIGRDVGLDFSFNTVWQALVQYVRAAYLDILSDGSRRSLDYRPTAADLIRLVGRNEPTAEDTAQLGRVSYNAYVAGMALVCTAWTSLLHLEWRKLTYNGHWGFQMAIAFGGTLAVIVGSCTLTSNANQAAGIISDEWANGSISTVFLATNGSVGRTFLTFAWCGALTQLLSFSLLCLAEHVRRKLDSQFLSTPAINNPANSGRQRERDPEDGFDDLPRYERNDPLGRPPSIGGSTSTPGTDCIPLETLESGSQVPAGPAPEYQEYDELRRPAPVHAIGRPGSGGAGDGPGRSSDVSALSSMESGRDGHTIS